MHTPAKTEQAQNGLSFANVLRDRLICGVILIDGSQQVAALAGQARHLLGLNPEQPALPAFEDLPAPLQAIVRETLASGKALADRQIELQAERPRERSPSASARFRSIRAGRIPASCSCSTT